MCGFGKYVLLYVVCVLVDCVVYYCVCICVMFYEVWCVCIECVDYVFGYEYLFVVCW